MKLSLLFLISSLILLPGCLTQKDLSKISVGMSKQDVIAQLGKPKDVAVQGRVEYFTYEGEAGYFDGRIGGDFKFIRFIDGKVESFGKKGDFDSTKDPTININTKSTVEGSVTTKGSPAFDLEVELRKLDRLKKDGLINEADFEAQKKRLLEKASGNP